MKLNDDKLNKFKHDVGDLFAKIVQVQKETDQICTKTQELMEEFLELIDCNEDDKQ